MTISKALKKLYTAMCGGVTDKTTAGDLINAIADNYSSGGDNAPLVVKCASDGEYVKITDEIEFDDIYDAATSGREVKLVKTFSSGVIHYRLQSAFVTSGIKNIVFESVTANSTSITVETVTFKGNKNGIFLAVYTDAEDIS